MRAVVTAGGVGTRLLPATKEIPKEMFPVFDAYEGEVVVKPVIQIIFERLYDVGVREFCFVVGRGKRVIEDHFTPDWQFVEWLRRRGKERQARLLEDFYRKVEESTIFWVSQPEPLGFGHAVLMSEPFVDGPFLLAAGDTVLQNGGVLKELAQHPGDLVLLVTPVEDPRQYGVAVVKGDRVTQVVEKPASPPSNYAILPFYRLPPDIFKLLRQVRPGVGGEIQLTDAIQLAVEEGLDVRAVVYEGEYVDVGTPATYLNGLKSIRHG